MRRKPATPVALHVPAGHRAVEDSAAALLHRQAGLGAGIIQGVLAHGAGNTAPSRSGARHVATVAHMLASTGLIGTNVIGADDLAVFLSNEGFTIVPKPIRKSISFCHVPIPCIGLASSDRRADNAPNGPGIALERWDGCACQSASYTSEMPAMARMREISPPEGQAVPAFAKPGARNRPLFSEPS